MTTSIPQAHYSSLLLRVFPRRARCRTLICSPSCGSGLRSSLRQDRTPWCASAYSRCRRIVAVQSTDYGGHRRAQVLLVNPTPHAPTTAHLVSSYLSLSRTARKNVRRICVVGGGWWTRVSPCCRSRLCLGLADLCCPSHGARLRSQVIIGIFSSTLLSAKSARKLVQCATLSALAEKVGAKAFTQVDLPLEVYACVPSPRRLPPSGCLTVDDCSANAVIEKAITLPDVGDKPPETTFGVPLEQARLLSLNLQICTGLQSQS